MYTYTSPGICRHPFQIVYTYMYPDAARALPAALTLWAAMPWFCGQYRCTFFLPFLFRILPPPCVLLYVCILWAAASVKVYTFYILRVTICIHFLYLFLYPDAAPALLAAIVFLSGYLQQYFKLRCTFFISLFIFRRRLRVTICIHILSGYLQQHLRLRYTFFNILFFSSFLPFVLYIPAHTTHGSEEPIRAPFLPSFAFLFALLVIYTPECF